jgi:hypothetical protein
MVIIDIMRILEALPDDITRSIGTDMRNYLTDIRESSAAYLQWADVFVCKVCENEMHPERAFVDMVDNGVSAELLCPKCVGLCERCGYPTKAYVCDECSWGIAMQGVEDDPIFRS